MPTIKQAPATLRTQLRPDDAIYIGAAGTPNTDHWTERKYIRSEVSVMDYGAVGDGVTDDSAAFTAAMTAAAGAPTLLPTPPVRYKLLDCQIPTATGCHLRPVGKVIIDPVPNGSWGGLYFRGEENFGAEVAITAIADHADYPAVNDQVVSKITGVFTGYVPGDIVYLYSNEKDALGNFLGEYFEVLDVDPASSAFIYANKKLYHTFDTAAFAPKARKVDTIVPIIIEKGIRFKPSGDTSAAGARRAAMLIRMPIRPDISAHFDDVWGTGIEVMGDFRGHVDLTYQDIHVDYALSGQQLGYVGLRTSGGFGTWWRVNGNKSGALCDAAGTGGTYDGSQWFKNGTPLDNVVYDSSSQNCRRSAFRTHNVYRDTYINCVADNSAMDDEENNNFWNAFAITGRDITFINCIGRGVGKFCDINGAYGSSVSDTWKLINCVFESNRGAQTLQTPFLAAADADCPDKAIEIIGGYAHSNQILFNLAKTLKSVRIGGGFTAKNDYALMQITAANTVYLDDLTEIADSAHQSRSIFVTGSITAEIHIGRYRVAQNASNNPVAIVAPSTPAVVNIHTDLRGIVSQTGSSLALVWSGSTGTATTAKRPVGPAFSATIPDETKVTYEDGFVVHNTAPTAGGKAEWRRTTTGWKLANPIDA